MLKKLKKFYYFHLANPVLRKVEAGGFKWVFRRFWLEISTLSGNFKVRFTASEHPYGYLMAGEDNQTQGFAERLYMIGSLLTTEQKLVNDIDKALQAYSKRLEKAKVEEEDEDIALEEVKAIEEHAEMAKKAKK